MVSEVVGMMPVRYAGRGSFAGKPTMKLDPTMQQQKSATNAKRTHLSVPARNGIMIAVGVLSFAILSILVLYAPIMYGDMIPNYGIIMMMTVPVIVGVATRVCLDAWLDR